MIQKLDLFKVFFKTGLISFGASASEVIIENIVEKKRWMTLDEIREAITLSGLCPGPFHVNLVIYLGYTLSGKYGALIAMAGFILPSAIIGTLLASALLSESTVEFLHSNPGIMLGILASVSGILLNAIRKLSKGQFDSIDKIALLVISIFVFYNFKIPFIAGVLGSGIIYMLIRLIFFAHRKSL